MADGDGAAVDGESVGDAGAEDGDGSVAESVGAGVESDTLGVGSGVEVDTVGVGVGVEVDTLGVGAGVVGAGVVDAFVEGAELGVDLGFGEDEDGDGLARELVGSGSEVG